MTVLPGMFDPSVLKYREPLKTLTHMNVVVKQWQANPAGATLVAPTGIRQGDLLTFQQGWATEGFELQTVPTDFTRLHSRWGSGNHGTIVSAKIAKGNENGATLIGETSVPNSACILRHFRGNSPILAFSAAQSVQYHETSANPVIAAIAASGGVAPLLILAVALTSGTLTGVSFGTIDGYSQEPGNQFGAGYDIQNVGDTLTDKTVDIGDGGGANHLGGFYINVS